MTRKQIIIQTLFKEQLHPTFTAFYCTVVPYVQSYFTPANPWLTDRTHGQTLHHQSVISPVSTKSDFKSSKLKLQNGIFTE